MAETGARSTLQAEFLDAGGDTDTIILGNGINSPGLTTKAFDIQPSHSYVTLVTMIAPSLDWFVGVSAFTLRNGNAWMSEVTVGLFAYDAGTDNGPSFTSPNTDTNPQIPIALLGTPFSDTPPLGTFTFTLLTRLDADFDVDGGRVRHRCGDVISTRPNRPAIALGVFNPHFFRSVRRWPVIAAGLLSR